MSKENLLSYKPNGDYFNQTKNLLFLRTISCNRLVELLHKQLIRKNRAKKEYYNHPTKNKVYIVKIYNIKSPATRPYNRNINEALGLNQFFVGQSPYKNYNGSISDGIYHDTVEIQSRNANSNNLHSKEWLASSYAISTNNNYIIFHHQNLGVNYALLTKATITTSYIEYKNKEDILRAKLIFNLTANLTIYNNFVKQKEEDTLIIEKEEDTQLGADNKVTLDTYINPLEEFYNIEVLSNVLNTNVNLKLKNELYKDIRIKTISLSPKLSNPYLYDNKKGIAIVGMNKDSKIELGVNTYTAYLADGRIVFIGKIFEEAFDKYVFKINVYETFNNNDMPIRGSFKFVKDWNTTYRLYVSEDTELWQNLVAPVVLFVAIVITVYSWGTTTPLLVSIGTTIAGLGTVVTVVGIAAENKKLIKIGKILGVVGSVVAISGAIYNLLESSALEIGSNSTLTSSDLASNSGLTLTANTYITTNSLGNATLSSSTSFSVGTTTITTTSKSTFNFAGELISTNSNAAFNTGGIILNSSSNSSLTKALSEALSLISKSYKVYGDARQIFKSPNEFKDEDMPTNEDKRPIRTDKEDTKDEDNNNIDLELYKPYDLGLEEGTLLYIKSVMSELELQ